MSLPTKWTIRDFRASAPHPEFGAVAMLFEARKDKDGKPYEVTLPSAAFAADPMTARAKLTAFLEAELAAEAKRRANAEALGARMSKNRVAA